MKTIPNILTDRGSKYAVTFAPAPSKAAALEVLKTLKRAKKFSKATHNSWALLLADGTQIKNDDGEGGAGNVILRMLERENCTDTVIIVTRWYGGVHLGGDRFAHVRDCVKAAFAAM